MQIPISALSPERAELGASGESFYSTTKMKCVPLLPLYSRHQVSSSSRGVRAVPLHSARYTPRTSSRITGVSGSADASMNIGALGSFDQHTRTVSDSLLHLPPLPSLSLNQSSRSRAQKERQWRKDSNKLLAREFELARLRQLKQSQVTSTHRVEWGFYMNGARMRLANKPNTASLVHDQAGPEVGVGAGIGEEIMGDHHQRIEDSLDCFTQNSSLYYGRGIRGQMPSRAVLKLENKLGSSGSGVPILDEFPSSVTVEELRLPASRGGKSGGVTPAPTILPLALQEEEEEAGEALEHQQLEVTGHGLKNGRTFVTDKT